MAATMKDIAKETGLGLATISSYFNGGNLREKNRAAIESAIKELHFEVNEIARGLKSKRTRTVGIVIPELRNLFCTDIITVIEDILRSHGYATMVCDCRTDPGLEKEAVDFLTQKMVDGIFSIPVTADGSHLSSAVRKKKPVVVIDRKINGSGFDSVLVDNIGAAKTDTELLIQNGHTKIGIIAGPRGVFTAAERLLGYKTALIEHGLLPGGALIVHGDYTIESGKLCAQKLWARKEMTALFITNHEMTVGAVTALNQMKIKFPGTLSVIGFDCVDFARAITPPLTVVTQPTGEIGRRAAEIMLKRLSGNRDEPVCVRLPTQISAGESVTVNNLQLTTCS
ncbi:MAG: LacI family transcriptional regulator [Oscillospiraceae bacterium]|jgi:LacI family transcriptional regulator|nr:LacI family transcriptional regulator [Oscillospiraceae bacterium]